MHENFRPENENDGRYRKGFGGCKYLRVRIEKGVRWVRIESERLWYGKTHMGGEKIRRKK